MQIVKPIFIFGNPNSGTTLLQQLLLTHPCLSGPEGESQFLGGMPRKMTPWLGKEAFMLYAALVNMDYYCTEKDRTAEDAQTARTILGKYIEPNTRLLTKNPSDCFRARLLQAIFPDAFFIGINRNGYAVCEGIVRNRTFHPRYPQYRGLSTSIEDAATQWFRASVMMLSNAKFLRKYFMVRYEDFVSTPELVLNQVTDFCELPRYEFRLGQVEKNKNHEQIANLTAIQIATITRIAMPMLLHFEYEVIKVETHW